MTIGQLCNREVTVVDQDESIRTAIKLMRSHHVGDVVVVREDDQHRTPVGILTDRDIVVELLAKDIDLSTVAVKDVIDSELLTAVESDSVFDTVKHMRDKGVRRMPVVDGNGSLVGIFAMDDAIDLISEMLSDVVGLIKSGFIHERHRRT